GITVSTGLEELPEFGVARPVVFLDRVDARPGARPFAVQTLRERLLSCLARAMVADQHDVSKAVELEAPRRGFQHALEHVVARRDRARKSHVPARRVPPAFL